MINRKLLFSVFNTVLKSYSTKLVNAHNCRRNYNCLCSTKYYHVPTASQKVIAFSTIKNGIVTFEEMQKIVQDGGVLLIDVREPNELQETGTIPGSINIPLGEVEGCFKNTSDDFFKKYGRHKPAHEFPIVFSCLLGKRSATAQKLVQELGYTNVRNFLGGWSEWSEKIQ